MVIHGIGEGSPYLVVSNDPIVEVAIAPAADSGAHLRPSAQQTHSSAPGRAWTNQLGPLFRKHRQLFILKHVIDVILGEVVDVEVVKDFRGEVRI